jgi:DNA-directed RNA polymerase specialized sigma24 family protein
MHPALKPIRIAARPPATEALAAGLVSTADLLRLKALARFHARGLPPDVGWSDLLQEAFARLLDGTRQRPSDVAIVPFIAGVMRSLRSDYWRRAKREARSRNDVNEHSASDSLTPERCAIARQELEQIDALFVDDRGARRIIAALAEGLSPSEIRRSLGVSRTEYESIRKRMRRALLREGLRSPQR